MIMLNNSSVVNVKYGSQQVDKVYHGSNLVSNLVWEDPWIEYTFPNQVAKMSDGNGLGFATSANGGSMGSGYSYYMFDYARLTKASYNAKGDDSGASLNLAFPNELGLVKIQKITLYGTRQCTIFRICAGANSTTYTNNVLDAGDMDIFLDLTKPATSGLLEYEMSELLKQEKINNVRVFGTKPSNTSVIYLGDVFFTFLARKNKLVRWLNKYNLPYPDALTNTEE